MSHHSSVPEHWQFKPGVLGLIPSNRWPFHFPLFSSHDIRYLINLMDLASKNNVILLDAQSTEHSWTRFLETLPLMQSTIDCLILGRFSKACTLLLDWQGGRTFPSHTTPFSTKGMGFTCSLVPSPPPQLSSLAV